MNLLGVLALVNLFKARFVAAVMRVLIRLGFFCLKIGPKPSNFFLNWEFLEIFIDEDHFILAPLGLLRAAGSVRCLLINCEGRPVVIVVLNSSSMVGLRCKTHRFGRVNI